MAMVDSGALLGLIGAAGGALIGGAAGVFGPLLLKRRERRELEADRVAERLALENERKWQLADDKLRYLTITRVRTRLWFDFLVQTVSRASAGEQIDIQAFHAERNRLAEDATDICYELARLRMTDHSGDPNGVLQALRNASEMIYRALMVSEGASASAPSVVEIAVALDEVVTARSWFRLAIDQLVQEQYPPDPPAATAHPLPPSTS
ncbi:hypothetical protein ACGF0D_43660 [Kitasatospora sp. NPDC048298]|uniref:hypothetical protein n=1 Tax=Kitasatospora sp. NPDC048298 TaxID=3364049 RepID=UPI00371CC683